MHHVQTYTLNCLELLSSECLNHVDVAQGLRYERPMHSGVARGCMWVPLHPIHAPVHPSYARYCVVLLSLSQYAYFTTLSRPVI